ncbi:MAG TPA: hypothetical protein P5089_02360 [Candidatus Portnoybacteria bacterium]|nr:hypothetical protein [Candidatus Portnoybacteria bacterium]
MEEGLVIGTRYFDNRAGSSPDKIIDFAQRSSLMAEKVIIAVNVAEDKSGAWQALKNLRSENLIIIGVTPWVKFVQPMNVLLDAAASFNARYFLSCSVEIKINQQQLNDLMLHMDSGTLCVGARLPEHEFSGGHLIVEGSGSTIPWNTCCIWNLEKFSLVGFPLAGDAAFSLNRKMAGVEELTALAVMQKLYGTSGFKAKLIEIAGIKWETEFADNPDRRVAHLQKIASKRERPGEQLKRLGLSAPEVQHIARQ